MESNIGFGTGTVQEEMNTYMGIGQITLCPCSEEKKYREVNDHSCCESRCRGGVLQEYCQGTILALNILVFSGKLLGYLGSGGAINRDSFLLRTDICLRAEFLLTLTSQKRGVAEE